MNTNILHTLIRTPAPSNFETNIRKYIKSVIPSHKKVSLVSDKNTSLAYYVNAHKKKTIVLDAHMDEISGQVISITEDGFCTINMTGPLIEHMHGRPVLVFSSILNKTIPGVILIDQVHVEDARKEKEDTYNNKILYLDIGLKNKKETKSKIEIGDAVIADYSYTYLQKNIITSRGLDNKLGVYILMHLLLHFIKHSNQLNYNIVCNFSGDEETGKTSLSHLKHIQPDSIIVIDTDFSTDVPFLNSDMYGKIDIGKGAIITRSNEDDGLFSTFKNLATKHKIPLQITVPGGGESMLSHYIRQYTAKTQFIAVPLRNIHSPVETADLQDVTAVFTLLKHFLTKQTHTKKNRTIKRKSSNKRKPTRKSKGKRKSKGTRNSKGSRKGTRNSKGSRKGTRNSKGSRKGKNKDSRKRSNK